MSEIISGGYGGHGDASAGWMVVFGYGGHPAPEAPRVLSAENAQAGRLCLFFNETMKNDSELGKLANYVVTPLPGYGPLTLLTAEPGTDRVCFDFIGGPGAYRICAYNVRDTDDDLLVDPDHRCATFFVDKPGVQAQTLVRIFDTVLGPIGLRQTTTGTPGLEDLLQGRIISQGVTQQLNNVINDLAPTGATRDGSRIPFLRIR